jgi:oligogalacturonide lyase
MTAPALRQFGRRSDTLLYWSERFGGRQAFQLDLKTGDSHQLTDVTALDPSSLALTSDQKSMTFFDGGSLMESHLASLRSRELHKVPDGASRTGMAVSGDGSILFVEQGASGARLQRVSKTGTSTIAQTQGQIDFLAARPRFPQVLYRENGALWLVNLDGSGKSQLQLASGRTGELVWTQSGRTLLYLHIPDNPRELITLREYDPAARTDRQIARTSQFESVAPNGDSSVFVGASRSLASAYVLILLRVTRRELTLCEHHASDPKMVQPVFSPDSQSVFFTSDRHGKAAVYRVHVEKFVEATPSDSGTQ